MKAETTELTLDGWTYKIGHAPGKVALLAGARLLNALGPAVAGFAQGRGAGRTLSGVSYLMQSPELGAHLAFLCDSFAPFTQVVRADGKASITLSDAFDVHFRGRLAAMLKWLEAAVEHDCGDFLDELRGRFESAAEVAEAGPSSNAPTQPETTG